MNENALFHAFTSAVETNFGFLVRRGYRKINPSVDKRTGFYEAVFVGQQIAVECLVEPRAGDIDCKICVLEGDQLPAAYAVNDAGDRVREGVATLLRRRGVRESLFTEVGEGSLMERIPITFRDFAAMMQKHAELLKDDASVLK